MNTETKILIVEDELLIAKALCLQLEKMGYKVTQISDGNDVMKTVLDFNPKYIVMDVRLKNNSCGINAAKELRKNNIQTKIIFTTGNAFETTLHQISGIALVALITKPVEITQLIEHLS
ncbi:MAG: response regulator [Bacteroidetes bacterium]|nr:response regulator [Bacteroidota bacterium]